MPSVVTVMSETRTRLVRHERVRVGERLSLLFDRVDHALVAVADVDAHQLRVEVEPAFSFRREEAAPFRSRDGDRIDRRLRGPLEERVLLGEVNDFLAGHGGRPFYSKWCALSQPKGASGRRAPSGLVMPAADCGDARGRA